MGAALRLINGVRDQDARVTHTPEIPRAATRVQGCGTGPRVNEIIDVAEPDWVRLLF